MWGDRKFSAKTAATAAKKISLSLLKISHAHFKIHIAGNCPEIKICWDNFFWRLWAIKDSNLKPPRCKRGALANWANRPSLGKSDCKICFYYLNFKPQFKISEKNLLHSQCGIISSHTMWAKFDQTSVLYISSVRGNILYQKVQIITIQSSSKPNFETLSFNFQFSIFHFIRESNALKLLAINCIFFKI